MPEDAGENRCGAHRTAFPWEETEEILVEKQQASVARTAFQEEGTLSNPIHGASEEEAGMNSRAAGRSENVKTALSAAFQSEVEGREVLFSVWCFRIDRPAHVCWQRIKQRQERGGLMEQVPEGDRQEALKERPHL